MRALQTEMRTWQLMHGRRLLAASIQQDAGQFCCICLTNPAETTTTSADERRQAVVSQYGSPQVNDPGN